MIQFTFGPELVAWATFTLRLDEDEFSIERFLIEWTTQDFCLQDLLC